ncbi:MAG TPA: cytochrome c [Candidatus Cybelea sp.]|jgi:mono/diheme cytochrome c family protein|nr:cytochrome c [Candidatus Cybelea sp.]
MIRGIAVGVVATLIVLALAVYLAVEAGLVPANADAKAPHIERWMARTSLHAALAREAPKTSNPVPLSDENLLAGIKLYAANCAVCHGAADAQPSTIAQGLYQKPPQLAKDGVEDDPDGVTFWKITHGIRLTGMPSFGKALNENQIWQLTLFLKHMDGLPSAPQRIWKAVKSSTEASS